jgi:hypothetical protein
VTGGVASRNASVGLRLRAGLDRRALPVAMPIGPLAVAVVRGILPYSTTDSNAVMARHGSRPPANAPTP